MSEKKYLDNNGLLFFWTVLKNTFAKKENTISLVKVNNTAQTVVEGAVNITVPTKVSGLENDSAYQTESDVANAIANAVGEMTGLEFVKLAEGEYNAETGVPNVAGTAGKIYLTKNSGSAPNQYDEYIWLATDNTFEKIGTTSVDLSGYLLKADMVAITNEDIDAIVAT